MSMRDLENRAGNIATMLADLVRQGDGARSLVRQALMANGDNSSRALAEAERISCAPELYLGVCRVLSRWIGDVHRELNMPVLEENAPPQLPPSGKR